MSDTPKVKSIQWSKEFPPNEECGYDHVKGVCPFGKFLIAREGWEGGSWPTIVNAPWIIDYATFADTHMTFLQAQEACQQEYERRVLECLEVLPGSNEIERLQAAYARCAKHRRDMEVKLERMEQMEKSLESETVKAAWLQAKNDVLRRELNQALSEFRNALTSETPLSS